MHQYGTHHLQFVVDNQVERLATGAERQPDRERVGRSDVFLGEMRGPTEEFPVEDVNVIRN